MNTTEDPGPHPEGTGPHAESTRFEGAGPHTESRGAQSEGTGSRGPAHEAPGPLPEAPGPLTDAPGALTEAPGLHAKGPGPVSPALMLSDRAGEESFQRHGVATANDPLALALRMLDSITTPDVTLPDGDSGAGAATKSARPTAPTSPDESATRDEADTSDETDTREKPGTSAEPGTRDQPDTRDQPGTPGAPSEAPEPEHTPSVAAQTRREEILDGASHLFAERGYHGSSLRDISREVGISHPGMLHHFSSKDALLGAVIDRMEDHAQGLLDATERIATSEASLDAALGGPWNPKNHQMGLLATLAAEVVNPKHPGRYRIARLRLVHEHVLETVLETFAARGELAEDAKPPFVARSTFSLLLSLAVRERSVRALQRTESAEPVRDVHAFVRHYIAN